MNLLKYMYSLVSFKIDWSEVAAVMVMIVIIFFIIVLMGAGFYGCNKLANAINESAADRNQVIEDTIDGFQKDNPNVCLRVHYDYYISDNDMTKFIYKTYCRADPTKALIITTFDKPCPVCHKPLMVMNLKAIDQNLINHYCQKKK